MNTTIITAIAVPLITGIFGTINIIIANKTNHKIETIEALKNDFQMTVEEIKKEFNTRRDKDNLEIYKTFLTDFISDLEMGIPKTEIQKERAHEIYKLYTELGGNSFIHSHWEKLVEKGVL